MGWFETVNNWVVAAQGGAPQQQLDSSGTAAITAPSTDEYAAATVAESQQVSAHVEPVIPENVTNIQGADEQGTYKAVITDTSTPATQKFVDSYVDASKTGEIDRIGYTHQADLGDSKTQDLIKQGYSPLQATSLQRDEKIAELVGKGYSRDQALESREVRYYTNEAKKAADNIDAVSASYHHDAMKSGLPQEPNRFEHAGDLARQFGYKMEGVSNVPGTKTGDPLTIPFKGSFLEDANIITKTQRTGEMGDYKYLGKPFSSTFGILDIDTQQAIGRKAAASGLASGKEGLGWSVDEHAMDKYTPELTKGAGFNLAYKEATFGNAGKVRGGTATDNAVAMVSDNAGKGKAFQVEMEDGSMVTRYESDLNPFANLLPQTKSAPVLGMDKDTVVKSPGITTGTINDFLLPEDRVVVGGKSDYTVDVIPKFGNKESQKEPQTVYEKIGVPNIIPDMSVNVGVPAVSVTGAKRTVDMTTAPPGNWMNRYTGGRSGGDESIAGWKTDKILLPLRTPINSAMYRGDFGLTIGGTRLRRSKHTIPVIKRTVAPKPAKKPYGMMTIEDHAILKNLGRDFFKFKVGTPDTLVKSNRARVNPVVNVNTDSLGLKQTTKSTITLPKINMPKGKSNTSVNISGILNRATKKVKSK